MNIKRFGTVAAGLALAAGAIGCSNDSLTALNQNPNSPTDAPVGAVFTDAALTAVRRYLGGGHYNLRGVELVAQQMAEVQYPDEDQYNRLRAANTSGDFSGPYTSDLENMRKVAAKGQALKQPAVYAPALAMQAFSFSYVTDMFGDIPYSEALKGDTAGGSLTPVYDAQKDIYAGLFATLDKVSADLAADPAGDPGLGSADPLFGGDITGWQKFANSLHARLAMRIVNVDPATADAELTKAFNAPGGLIETNADNAKVEWPGDGVFNNPVSNGLKGRDDFRMSRTMMDIMTANDDPRIPIYAQPVQDSSLYASGYGGQPNGIRADSASAFFNVASRLGAVFYPGQTAYGFYGGNGATFPTYVLTASEVLFTKAEAAERGLGGLTAGQAAGFYNAAILASMEQWGVSSADASAYLASPAVAYKGGTDGLKQIAVQKWLSLFMNGTQAWAEWRRTCQPSTVVTGVDAIITTVPRRFQYSITEGSANGDNLQAAIDRQGPDEFTTRMYWDTQPQAAPTWVSTKACEGDRS